MIPQTQTILNGGESGEPGNCWAACIASIVGVPIKGVPNFVASTHWFQDTQVWLNDRGWGLVQMPWPDRVVGGVFGGQFPPAVVVLSGWGPRGVRHSIVAQVLLDEEGFPFVSRLHDPHPSREGLDMTRGELYVSFVFRINDGTATKGAA